MELAKLEAFDQWLSKPVGTKEEVSTKQMFERITSKISHMLKYQVEPYNLEAARDLLVCMWVLRDLITQKGVVEITTASPSFYLTRFCTAVLNHISRHHDDFYSKPYHQKYVAECSNSEGDSTNGTHIVPQFHVSP